MIKSIIPRKINVSQKNILKRLKKYISINEKDYKNYINYFPPHSYCDGYSLLKYWINPRKNLFLRLKILFRELYLLSFEYNINIKKKKNLKYYSNIIITWGNYNNFSNEGIFSDKYYNIQNNKIKNTLWIIINTSNKKIEKFDKNLIILEKKILSFSVIRLIKNLTNLNKLLRLSFSYQNDFALKVWGKISLYFNYDVKSCHLPYEAQPFQNYIIHKCKKNFPKIFTYGLIHSFPLGLPTNLIYRQCSPNKLLVSGIYQKNYFCNLLNWHKNDIQVINSLRFQKKNNMNNKIYLPYFLEDPKFIYNKLLKLKKSQKFSKLFNYLKIQNHPETTNSIKHQNLIKHVKNTLLNKNLISKKNNFSIFIGCSSAAIEALVRGVKVIHISKEPILEIYSNLWNFLDLEEIYPGIFTYNLKKNISKNNILKINQINKKKILNKYFY